MQNQFTPRSSALQNEGGPAVKQQSVSQPNSPSTPLAGPIQTKTPPPASPTPTQTQFTPPSPKKKIIIILVVLILVAAIAGYLFYQSRQPKPAAQVGGEKITYEAVASFSQDCDMSQKEAVEYLVDDKVLTKWANDEKITVSGEEQEAEEVRISGQPATVDCTRTQAKVNLLREKLFQNTEKFREGKFIIINFGRYANPNPIQVTKEATGEADRSQKLQEDRAYADNLTNSIYSDLKEGKLSFEQAIEKVNNDPKVGVNSPYDTTLQSGRFTATDYLEKNGLLDNDSVRQKIDSLKENEISEPFIGQFDVSFCEGQDGNCDPQYVDARWIIAKVEKIGKGYDESSEKLLEKIRNKYDAKIYLK